MIARTKPSKLRRQDVLDLVRIAGYHDDQQKANRLYVENRIGWTPVMRAFREGAEQKKNGIPCTCQQCKTEA